MLVPITVRPGTHEIVIRTLPSDELDGTPRLFVWPITVTNSFYGSEFNDPAYTSLRARFPEADVKFAFLRRAAYDFELTAAHADETAMAGKVYDTSLWNGDPSYICHGWDSNLALGDRPSWLGAIPTRHLIRFDLSGLSAGTEILGAELRMTYCKSTYEASTSHVTGIAVDAYPIR
ncbi:hypothetical protein ACFL4W_05190, partial [Planctomycetota bacterium]